MENKGTKWNESITSQSTELNKYDGTDDHNLLRKPQMQQQTVHDI
jgi:hypothetical protein